MVNELSLEWYIRASLEQIKPGMIRVYNKTNKNLYGAMAYVNEAYASEALSHYATGPLRNLILEPIWGARFGATRRTGKQQQKYVNAQYIMAR